jgi:developmental checkpoint coupling sporulation initiation to replication initiation
MVRLSNDLLIQTYYRAISLQLSKDFIEILKSEINRRNLVISESIA